MSHLDDVKQSAVHKNIDFPAKTVEVLYETVEVTYPNFLCAAFAHIRE